jgi:alpha-tubulin suppressor-like RCC1 family protein
MRLLNLRLPLLANNPRQGSMKSLLFWYLSLLLYFYVFVGVVSCQTTNYQEVWTFGSNLFGPQTVQSPTKNPTTVNVVSIATSRSNTYYITNTSQLYGVGSNVWGQLGTGGQTGSNTPILNPFLLGVASVSGGDWHTCAILSNSSMYTFGHNGYGQLGIGSMAFSYNVPQYVMNGVSQCVCGASHTVFIRGNGTVYSTGSNLVGQLGTGSLNNSISPLMVPLNSPAVQLAAGYQHTLVLLLSGDLIGFGGNTYGQLGLGYFSVNVSFPTLIMSLGGIKQISAGGFHSGYVTTGNQMFVSGLNTGGQLGTQYPTNSNKFIANGLVNIKSISLGYDSSMAMDYQNQLFVFGSNRNGLRGLGDSVMRTTATLSIFSTTTIISAFAIGYAWSVFLLEGSIYIAGQSIGFDQSIPTQVFQLGGDNDALWTDYTFGFIQKPTALLNWSPTQIPPTKMSFTTRVDKISIGSGHFIVRTSGDLYIYGSNDYGELGFGDQVSRSDPTKFNGLNVTDFAAGWLMSYLVTNTSQIYGCGQNAYGQIGLNDVNPRYAITLMPVSGAVSVSANWYQVFILTQNGSVYAMGINAYGALGTGTYTDAHTPVLIPSLPTNVVQIACSLYSTYFLTQVGTVYSTGSNVQGQVCTGSFSPASFNTVQLIPLRNITKIGAAATHVLFLTKSSDIYSCGDNQVGQLGLGDLSVGSRRSIPSELSNFSTKSERN